VGPEERGKSPALGSGSLLSIICSICQDLVSSPAPAGGQMHGELGHWLHTNLAVQRTALPPGSTLHHHHNPPCSLHPSFAYYLPTLCFAASRPPRTRGNRTSAITNALQACAYPLGALQRACASFSDTGGPAQKPGNGSVPPLLPTGQPRPAGGGSALSSLTFGSLCPSKVPNSSGSLPPDPWKYLLCTMAGAPLAVHRGVLR
jgi:hypothetical protein